MLNKPRYVVTESWDQSGTVDLYFQDNMTPDLHDRISNEVDCKIHQLEKDERSVYHLENIVDSIFYNMISSGNLKMNRNKRWSWAERI